MNKHRCVVLLPKAEACGRNGCASSKLLSGVLAGILLELEGEIPFECHRNGVLQDKKKQT